MSSQDNAAGIPVSHPAWQRVLLARHPKRPHAVDYLPLLFSDFQEIHGDRNFGDDPAIIAGMAQLDNRPVAVVAQEKGRDTKQRLHRNFGMPNPEGYRKALRVMQLAAKFHRPVITLMDTPGAYPGIDAEERGQGEAIARNLREMARLDTPVVAVVIGEGGSGGALAMGVANVVLMMENSVYSVISPENCSTIIYRDRAHTEQAAAALKLTAVDLLELGLIDGIVPEPPGGAQEDYEAAAALLRAELLASLDKMTDLSPAELVQQRYDKFRQMGELLRVKKTTWIGIALAVVVLGYLVISSFQRPPFRCQVCITFRGNRNCAKGSAQTEMDARRTAATTACADLSSGVIDANQCENTTPDSVEWLARK